MVDEIERYDLLDMAMFAGIRVYDNTRIKEGRPAGQCYQDVMFRYRQTSTFQRGGDVVIVPAKIILGLGGIVDETKGFPEPSLILKPATIVYADNEMVDQKILLHAKHAGQIGISRNHGAFYQLSLDGSIRYYYEDVSERGSWVVSKGESKYIQGQREELDVGDEILIGFPSVHALVFEDMQLSDVRSGVSYRFELKVFDKQD